MWAFKNNDYKLVSYMGALRSKLEALWYEQARLSKQTIQTSL